MKTKIFCILALGLLSGSQTYARGGGTDTGNGIDRPVGWKEPEKAWFRREYDGQMRSILYCMEVANDFGIPQEEIYQDVQNAFRIWKDYSDEHKIHRGLTQYTIVFDAKRIQSCDGTEDLKLSFGVKDPAYWASRIHFQNPIAFAKKQSSENTTWGKGYIWVGGPSDISDQNINRNWTSILGRESLKGAILHELGHVFGNQHLPQTIMQADAGLRWDAVPDQVPQILEMLRYKMNHIDHENPLITHEHYTGTLPVYKNNKEDHPALWEKLARTMGVSDFKVGQYPVLLKQTDPGSRRRHLELNIQHPEKTIVLEIRVLMYGDYHYLEPMFCSNACVYGRKYTEAVMIRMPDGSEYPGIFSTNGTDATNGGIELGPRLTLLNFFNSDEVQGITLLDRHGIIQGWVPEPKE